MVKIIHYLMRQKLLINLVVVLICLVGFYSLSRINREAVPDVNFDMVSITTVYAGASPNDAEELISVPIEKKLRGVDGIDKVRSYSVENVSVVVVYIDDKVRDKKKVVQDIKDAVDQVENLPTQAEKPLVKEVTFDNTPLMDLAIVGVNGDVPYDKLRKFADEAEDHFFDIPGIAKIEKYGFYDREYLVEVDPDALDKYHIGMNTLIKTLQTRNIDLPGGSLKIGKKEFVLRTKGQFKNAEEIRNTVIMANDSGFVTRIKDVAKVTDTYEEADVYHRVNGKDAIVLQLWKKGAADEINLSNTVQDEIKKYKLPGYEDIKIEHFNDLSTMTRHRLASVIEEAIVGIILLGIIMYMMLGARMATLVSISIPISFMISFAAMSYFGITFNIISMFGMIMVLGMIVDFSIVVSENSHRYMEHGLKKTTAIERGVGEVFWPVTVTFLCICIAFTPLLLVSGMMGKFIKAIPIVIMTALTASWVMAMFILPTYLNMYLREEHKKGKKADNTVPMRIIRFIGRMFSSRSRRQEKLVDIRKEDPNFERGGFGRVQRKYKSLLTLALNHRYKTVGLIVFMLILSLSLVPVIGFQFMPAGGEESITVKVKLPQETNLNTNLEEMCKVEKILLTLPPDELVALHSYIGEESSSMLDPKPGKGTHKSTFNLYLSPEKDRKRTATEINLYLRKAIANAQKTGQVTNDMDIKVEVSAKGPPVGKPVNVEIRGKDYEVIKKIAKEYLDYLKTVDGLRDLAIDLEEGKREYRYGVNEAMAALTGVSAYDIAIALNASFAGSVATKVNQNEEQVGVRVRFPEDARSKMKSLNEVKIANSSKGLIPLDKVSTVTEDSAYTQINRLNYKRLVQVQADVDTSKTTSLAVNQLLKKKFVDIENRYPGYIIAYGGEQEDTGKTMGELGVLFLFALILMYIILTIFMKSLELPLIVMIAIPFALIGVLLALFTHRQPLSFMSVLGLFSLAGIIVSNTLVLVQFINNFRDEGHSLKEAIIEGGVVRLRPIILTAGSMVLELLPVIYGVGGKDYMVSPLALAFGYGLVFATIITLILVPCFYHIAEDIKAVISGLLSGFGIKMNPSVYQPAEAEEE